MLSFRTTRAAMAGALLLAGAAAASAQSWPTRNIQAISPFSAGNANDIVARIVLDQVSKQIGQTFVLENRPGGGGVIGVTQVAKAEPDGYTMLLLSSTLASHPVLHKALSYDPVKDFAVTALFGFQPSVLVASPSKGWKDIKDLVAHARANPGKLNYASAGVGSASQMAAERLRLAAKIQAQHIPFRGPVEAFTEVMAGRVDYYYLPISPALPNIKSGKVVALAVSTPERAKLLPDVPTVREAGFPTAEYLFWGGVAFPAKTPRPIVEKMNAEIAKALAAPGIAERLATFGVVPKPMSVAEFDKFYRDYVAETVKLAKDINLTPAN
ncbi:MAG: tripartite tricarboxylate transporter substrate binding protein [Alphaproteobacteria bacterium]|nr:tripartite tricarboxylate transporter substrate binding protein [Alphaproteobacteria bacterium]